MELFDTRQLHAFETLVQAGSFTAAAQKLQTTAESYEQQLSSAQEEAKSNLLEIDRLKAMLHEANLRAS
ncbi:MAG: LysR family transcriptional regulator, partial [Verrucomicrobiota bacterium]